MQVIENLKVKEKVYKEKLENGLTVMIIPKPGMKKKYMIWGTHYGSLENEFVVPGEEEKTLYDVSKQKVKSDSLRNKQDALFCAFVLIVVCFTWIITYNLHKKRKTEKERAWQQILMQSNKNTKDQK